VRGLKEMSEKVAITSAVGSKLTAALILFLTTVSLLPFQVGMLSRGGVPAASAYTAVVISSAVGTLLLGLQGKFSLTIGPSLAMNTFLVYSLVLCQGMSWAEAMGCTFTAAILLVLFVWRGWHKSVVAVVPLALRAALRSGLGLLLIVTALEQGHLLVPSTIAVTSVGNLAEPVAFLSMLGGALTMVLWLVGSSWAIISGVLAVALGACLLGLPDWPGYFFSIPDFPVQAGILKLPDWDKSPAVIIVLMLLLSVENSISLQALEGDAKKYFSRGMCLSLVSATLGAVLGAGGMNIVPSSLSSLAVSDRSGKSAIWAAGLLSLMLFVSPLAEVLAQCSFLAVPALLLAGFLLLQNMSGIDWHNGLEGLAAMLVFVFTALGNMLAGAAIGLIAYCLFKMIRDGVGSVHKYLYGITLIFLWQLLYCPL